MTQDQSAASQPAGSGQGARSEAGRGGPRREILIVLPGLLLALMIAMLDQLVVIHRAARASSATWAG